MMNMLLTCRFHFLIQKNVHALFYLKPPTLSENAKVSFYNLLGSEKHACLQHQRGMGGKYLLSL